MNEINGYLGQYNKVLKRIEYEHRLIWEKHFGPIPAGFHIHHKDGNKQNNDINNLEMINGKEHNRMEKINRPVEKDSIDKMIEKRAMNISEENTSPVFCVELNKSFNSIREAADELNGTKGNICNALNGRQKKAYGYSWKYLVSSKIKN
jgi:hypothetical protein